MISLLLLGNLLLCPPKKTSSEVAPLKTKRDLVDSGEMVIVFSEYNNVAGFCRTEGPLQAFIRSLPEELPEEKFPIDIPQECRDEILMSMEFAIGDRDTLELNHELITKIEGEYGSNFIPGVFELKSYRDFLIKSSSEGHSIEEARVFIPELKLDREGELFLLKIRSDPKFMVLGKDILNNIPLIRDQFYLFMKKPEGLELSDGLYTDSEIAKSFNEALKKGDLKVDFVKIYTYGAWYEHGQIMEKDKIFLEYTNRTPRDFLFRKGSEIPSLTELHRLFIEMSRINLIIDHEFPPGTSFITGISSSFKRKYPEYFGENGLIKKCLVGFPQRENARIFIIDSSLPEDELKIVPFNYEDLEKSWDA